MPEQLTLPFEGVKARTPQQVFMQAISDRPSKELRRGHIWHIGNIDTFSKNRGYFAVGRTTKSTIEKYDQKTRNFEIEELDTSPYTHCVFNSRIGLLGIAHKSHLSARVNGIASQIGKLLSQTDIIVHYGISVEILPIQDPDNFINAISSAYCVSSFTATFRGPNPSDADAYFQKPLASLVSICEAKDGKALIRGSDLNRNALTEIARSTAALGNDASAKITNKKGGSSRTVRLKGDAIKYQLDEATHEPKEVMKELEKIYGKVRENG